MTDDLLSYRPRTRLVLSEADMARLRDLYYDRDVPMTRVAAAFGLSTSTLYHGIAEMDWPRRSATFPIRTQPHRAAVEVGAAPHPVGSAEPEAPFDPQKLALDVAVAARRRARRDRRRVRTDEPKHVSRGAAPRRRDRLAVPLDSADRQTLRAEGRTQAVEAVIKQQQEKINALQNAGLMDVQRAKFAALKAEFAAVTSGQGQSAPLKAGS